MSLEAQIVAGTVLVMVVIVLVLLVLEVIPLEDPVVCAIVGGDLEMTPFGPYCITKSA